MANYLWFKALHLFGLFMWIGSMMGVANMLVAMGENDQSGT